MMDELNRVNPDEVLPSELQKAKAEKAAMLDDVKDLDLEALIRAEDAALRREISQRQSQQAALVTRRGPTAQRPQRPMRSGRR